VGPFGLHPDHRQVPRRAHWCAGAVGRPVAV